MKVLTEEEVEDEVRCIVDKAGSLILEVAIGGTSVSRNLILEGCSDTAIETAIHELHSKGIVYCRAGNWLLFQRDEPPRQKVNPSST